IIKRMAPADIPDGETLDFNFTVVNGIDFNETFTLEVNDTHPTQSLTISGLTPAQYGVSEHPKPGYAVVGNSVRTVDLNLPTCSASVEFVNEKAGRPGVEAIKVTTPAELNSNPTNGGWDMILYKWNETNSTWDPVETNQTEAVTGLAVLVEPGNLEAGHYKIEENLEDGWYEVGRLGSGCDFNYTIDTNVSTYECVFANALYGEVIINKAFVEGSEAVDFNFTQDINTSEPLALGDINTKKTYLNLKAGQYTVTEDDAKLQDPSPSYDLTGLVCTESLGDGEEDDNTTVSLLNRTASIDLDPGETIECTFTNRERGRINVLKTEDGNKTTEVWSFTLQGPEGIIEHNTTTGLNFADARLKPGETYTLCEKYVRDGWDADWFLNDVNITADLNLTEHEGHIDRCYDFNVSTGEIAVFKIDNISPPDAAMLGDYVWFDDDNNGIQDEGEDPVEGMTVELLDENGTLVEDLYGDSTKLTDANGNYYFYVSAGDYRVRFSGMPSNYVFAPLHSGTDAAVDSDADSDGLTGIITIAGTDDLTVDAGIYCTCFDSIDSDKSSSMGVVSASLMMLMTLAVGLFFVRREEQFKRNRR
ncbi:MAG: SdrD B-like domain-containing protein, partial [Sulfurimonas sp.]